MTDDVGLDDIVRAEVGHDGVGVLTLNDPSHRNAMTRAMNSGIKTAVEMFCGRTDVKAIIVTGAGPAFCAGADLAALSAAESTSDFSELYSGFLAVADSRLPTIAAVNGPAVGAGMNLALACDLIVAGNAARFDCKFLSIGIHPGGGHTWRLSQRVGIQTARAMVLFGERLSGQQAAARGLAWLCTDDEFLLSDARTIASRAAAVDGALMQRTKATLLRVPEIQCGEDAVQLEIEPQLWSTRQPSFGLLK
jgi:enoyl-CoA hydratase